MTTETTSTSEAGRAMGAATEAGRALKAKHRAMWAFGDYPAVMAIKKLPHDARRLLGRKFRRGLLGRRALAGAMLFKRALHALRLRYRRCHQPAQKLHEHLFAALGAGG